MGLIEEVEAFRDKMGGDYASVMVMGGGEIITISVKRDEEPRMDIKDVEPKVDEEKAVQAEQEKEAEKVRTEYKLTCPECGETFISKSPRKQMCPACKKRKRLESMAKYHERKNAEKKREKPVNDDIASTVQELISLGDE